jgi:hypothetical protein
MSNDQPGRRPPAKSSGGGAPMGSTISIVVAVAAVVLGFLILRNITDDSASSSGGIETPGSTGTDSSTTIPAGSSTTTISTGLDTSTTLPLHLTGATVVVANASGVPGAAGTMTEALKSVGFTTGTATNALGVENRLDVSKVYYIESGEAAAVAASVAQAMGGIQVAAMPTPVPVEGAATGLGDATVLLMLGKDYGGKALPMLAPADSTTTLPATPLDTTTTVAG